MTTDPFIEAARESAASKYQGDWDAFEQEPVDDWGYSEGERKAHVAGWEAARTHLAAQEPKNAGPHELDEDAPIRNLGYYRSATRCLCGYEVIWGEHDGDAGLDEAWRVHLMRSNVSAARRGEEKQ